MNDIILRFQKILNTNEPVRFINTYRGMPVSYTGHLFKINQDRALFNVPKAQILCMKESNSTFLRNRLLPEVVRGKVSRINWYDETVELSHFEYTDMPIGKRALVRVETQTPLPGTIFFHGSKRITRMKLIEISLKGAAILVHKAFVQKKLFHKSQIVVLHYTLPGIFGGNEGFPITYHGNIRNKALQRDGQFFRIGIQTFPPPGIEQVFTKYIAMRQRDLLKEIKKLCTVYPIL